MANNLCYLEQGCLNCLDNFNQGHFANTALQLMRSRYCAYVTKNADYLLNTWHTDYRPARIDFSENTKWIRLTILSSSEGAESDKTGVVHFQAYYIEQQQLGVLEECSNFIQLENQWFYCDGKIIPHSSRVIARNESCPCGSGKKFKRCCLGK